MKNNLEKYYEDTLDEHYLNIAISDIDKLDEITIHVMEQDRPDFVLPMNVKSVNDSAILRFELPSNATALKYYANTMQKEQFVSLFLKIINPFLDCMDWFLDAHQFLLDEGNIYVDRESGNVSYIYIPDNDYKNSDEDIFDFLRTVFTRFNITDDQKLTLEIYRFFDNEKLKTLTGLQTILKRNERPTNLVKKTRGASSYVINASNEKEKQKIQLINEDSNNKPLQPQIEMSSEIQTNKKKDKGKEKQDNGLVSNEEKPKDTDDFFINLFGDEEQENKKGSKEKKEKKSVGLFGGFRKSKKQEDATDDKKSRDQRFFSLKKNDRKDQQLNNDIKNEEVKGSPLFSPEAENEIRRKQNINTSEYAFPFQAPYDSSNTVVLDSDSTAIVESLEDGFLQLIASPLGGAPDHISLKFKQKQLFLGRAVKDEPLPDIAFPNHFKSIGRKHVVFEKHDDGIYIIDLGSLNHTTLDGETMVPNREYMLKTGSVIGLTLAAPIKYKVVLR